MLGGAARLRLLSALAERDGLSVSDIAESIGVDQPRASRLVNDSAERGLVTRTSDGRDARRSVVQLTDAGRAMLQTATDSRRTAVTEALAGFSAEETATFADLLTRFTAVWQHHRH
jgi:DNA-binding MarR family transcriptional regulator